MRLILFFCFYLTQDPTNLDKFNLASFHHLKNNLTVVDEEEEKAKQDPMYYIRKTNTETDSILNELQQTYKEPVSVWLIQPFKRDTKW